MPTPPLSDLCIEKDPSEEIQINLRKQSNALPPTSLQTNNKKKSIQDFIDNYNQAMQSTAIQRNLGSTDHEKPATIDLGVISSACRLPGGCNDLAEYWDLLKTGKDSSTRIPATRIATRDELMRGKYGPKYEGGHYLSPATITDFDAGFFKISKSEANSMDPQQRLLLELVAECLESSGLPPEEFSTLGVFVGFMAIEYPEATLEALQNTALPMLGSGACVLSGRISYWLGSNGPSLGIDTACSSSLVALNAARAALMDRTCSRAIVAAVNLNLSECGMGKRVNGGMLSYDATCKTFDARADGYGRSEGVSAILVEQARPSKAYASLIPSISVNHGGRGVSLVAPNGPAQAQLVQRTLLNSPDVVPTYWESHGTGTGVGDPIEINALATMLGEAVVGSTKALIGHGEAAAGLNGVMKVMQQGRHAYIPATLHMHCLNAHIHLGRLQIPVIGEDWQDPSRAGGVSSFGVSGTNAAMIMYNTDSVQKETRPLHAMYAVPVSAKSVASLEKQLANYESFLATTSTPMGQVAATAALGRQHYAQRAMLIISADGAVLESIRKTKTGPITIYLGKDSIGPKTLQLLALPFYRNAFDSARGVLGQEGAALYALAYLLRRLLPSAVVSAVDAHGAAALALAEGKMTAEAVAALLQDPAAAVQPPTTFHSLQELYNLAGQAYANGNELNWRAVYEAPDGQILLPTYAFNRSSHWLGRRLEQDVVEDGHLGVRTISDDMVTWVNNLSLLRHRELFRMDTQGLMTYLLLKSVKLSLQEGTSFSLHSMKISLQELQNDTWMKCIVDLQKGSVAIIFGEKEAASALFTIGSFSSNTTSTPQPGSVSSSVPLFLQTIPNAELRGDSKSITIESALIEDPLLPTVAVMTHIAEAISEESILTLTSGPIAYPIVITSEAGVIQAAAKDGTTFLRWQSGEESHQSRLNNACGVF